MANTFTENEFDIFEQHARELGLIMSGDRAPRCSELAFLSDTPTCKRFRYSFHVTSFDTKIQVRYFVGSKPYSGKISLERFLKLTKTDMQNLLLAAQAANRQYDELAAKLADIPVNHKHFVNSVLK